MNGWPGIMRTLLELGYDAGQVSKAVVILQGGGSVQEAREAMGEPARVPATFETLALAAAAARVRDKVEVKPKGGSNE